MSDKILEQIIQGCKKGNSESQELLYRMFADKMWVVCRRYAHDIEQAKDFLQEGFIIVYNKIHQYKGTGSFEGWMKRIFINIALSEFRKKKLIFFEINELSYYMQKHDEEEDNDESEFPLSSSELLQLIESLPPQYKMVFNLYVMEEFNHKEIAELLNISEGTSKSNLFRAREWLKRKIKEVIIKKNYKEIEIK